MEYSLVAAFAVYIGIVVSIAIAAYYNTGSMSSGTGSGFLVGNRSINFWLTALSAHASDMSDWLFMAYPGMIFALGLGQVWISIGLAAGMWVNWHWVAPALRSATEKYDVFTLSSYFERRFGDHSGLLRMVSAIMALIFFSIYVSAGLKGIGLTSERVFGMSYQLSVVVGLVVILGYVMMGGFTAIAWIDAFQATFLLGVILAIPIMVLWRIGGVNEVIIAARNAGVSLSILPQPLTFGAIAGSIMLAFGWGLGYIGQPHIITKFMGINNASELHKSKYVGMAWQLLALSAATMVGLVGIALFGHALANRELVFIEMVKLNFTPFIAGLVLCAILAATISTIDAQMLVLASILTEDVYKPLFNPAASRRQLVLVFRTVLCISAALALVVALHRDQTIYDVVWFAWTGLGCAFGPLVLFSLYAPWVNKYGALAGMIGGGLMAGIWRPWLSNIMGLEAVPGMLPGFLLSSLLIMGGSLLGTKKETK